jgi:N-acetylglucosaminyl-diphospho-decaprenol L-rhamnosyltransferase
MSLDIVIVNWNSGLFLDNCLNSLNKYGLNQINKVVIIDNASSDESFKSINTYRFKMQVIENNHNIGFGAACNQGAKLCSSPFVLFLNPDTEIFEKSLEIPLNFIKDKSNLNIGVTGIRLIDENGNYSTSCARFPSAKRYFYRALGLTTFFPRYFQYTIMTNQESPSSGLVDQINGAFFLIRNDLFKKLNGFDERFFLYMDEVDLSYRSKMLGFDSYFLSEAKAFHKGGGSSDQIKAKRVFYSLRSRLQFFHKHFNIGINLLMWFEVFLLEFFSRVLFSLIKLNLKKFFQTFKIFIYLYIWGFMKIIKFLFSKNK